MALALYRITLPLAIGGTLLGLMVSVSTGADPPWTAAGTKDGIVLAYRDDPLLEAREVRATTELPFPAQRIFPLVCDLAQYQTLVPGVEEARLIGGTLPTDYEIYLRYAPRFLVVAARDVVLRVKSASGTSGLGCEWSEVVNRVVERKGVVRMTRLRGSWTITPLEATRARVVYQVAVKPGGRIPAWLVRRGAIGALPEVIEQVRRCLEIAPDGGTAGSASCHL